jgi:hypothetical protein
VQRISSECRPRQVPSGFQFDIVFRVISTDGTQVLMSD